MLPRVLDAGRHHTSRAIVSNDCRKAQERHLCGVLAVKLWRSNPLTGTSTNDGARGSFAGREFEVDPKNASVCGKGALCAIAMQTMRRARCLGFVILHVHTAWSRRA